jgi:hypothetical protein
VPVHTLPAQDWLSAEAWTGVPVAGGGSGLATGNSC